MLSVLCCVDRWSFLYIFSLTLPHSTAVQVAWPDQAILNGRPHCGADSWGCMSSMVTWGGGQEACKACGSSCGQLQATYIMTDRHGVCQDSRIPDVRVYSAFVCPVDIWIAVLVMVVATFGCVCCRQRVWHPSNESGQADLHLSHVDTPGDGRCRRHWHCVARCGTTLHCDLGFRHAMSCNATAECSFGPNYRASQDTTLQPGTTLWVPSVLGLVV